MSHVRCSPVPRNRGAALTIAVLFFVLISIAIVMGSVNPVIRDFNSGSELINSKLSYFTAEAGDEDAIYRTKKGKQLSSPEVTTLNGGSVSVTVADISSSDKEVTSNSTVSSLVRNVKTVLNAGVGSDFAYGAQVGEGGLVMQNNSSITGVGGVAGNVYSNGPITGSSGTSITGTATAATSVTLDKQSTVCNQDNVAGQTNPQIDFAQSFVPSDSKPIYKVSLNIKKVGSSNPPTAYVKIVSDNAGSPSTTSLASATLPAAFVTSAYSWVDITFSSPYTVTAGQKYWLLVDATQDSSKYWVWCSDSNNGSGNGLGKYKQTWSTSGAWTQITGDLNIKTYLGAGPGTISGISSIGVDAHANTITSSNISGVAYCQTGSGNNKACNTSQPDPAPLNMPISQGNIDQWKVDATAGGTISGNCPGTTGCSNSMGPKKIVGNLTINSATQTLTGVLYVTGNILLSNNATLRCASSFGPDSCVILADGWVEASNNATLSGSGQTGSYALVVSTIAGCNGGSSPFCTPDNSAGIDIDNNTNGGVFFTSASMISMGNNATVKSITGYKLDLQNNAVIQYEQGVADTNFASGPGGGWNVKTWNEVQ